MDTTRHTLPSAPRRSIRALALGVTLAAAGALAPATAQDDWTSLRPDQTATERSIALVEGADPANFPATASEPLADVVITHRPGSWDV